MHSYGSVELIVKGRRYHLVMPSTFKDSVSFIGFLLLYRIHVISLF